MIIIRDPDAPVGLIQHAAITFFGDESSQNAHRFVVIGVLAIQSAGVNSLLKTLAEIRRECRITGEVGWTCLNDYNRPCYEKWISEFESCAKRRILRLSALVLDTSLRTNQGWDTADFDLGFNKLIYQLLLHRVGKRYGAQSRPIYGYLDLRKTKHRPEDLRLMLNGGLRKMGITCNPFRQIVFEDSKKSDLIQLVDLLIGGLAYDLNDHGLKPNARQAKIEVSWRITKLEANRRIDIWPFRYSKGKKVPRA